MADFGYFSDTDESLAVEELISQAQDLTILEQVSKINCSGFTDSVLSSDLETRFRKLKSFPVSKPIMSARRNSARSVSDEGPEIFSDKVGSFKGGKQIFMDSKQCQGIELAEDKDAPSGYASPPLKSFESSIAEDIFSAREGYPEGKKGLKKKFEGGTISFPSDSSNSWAENVVSREKKGSKSRSEGKTLGSPFGSSQLSIDSHSPPRKTGCFWCSPKRGSKKKSKENFNLELDWGDKRDECLSDMGAFSAKEQQKILKKAMKEEEKISREAEKVVKWAKQASARMSSHGVEDESSEDDSGK